jgi:hypothetical protein
MDIESRSTLDDQSALTPFFDSSFGPAALRR